MVHSACEQTVPVAHFVKVPLVLMGSLQSEAPVAMVACPLLINKTSMNNCAGSSWQACR